MTLQQLLYFLAAAQHRSFSAAAESLYMTQPSLSEQVRALERELGVGLFIRGGRGLELTDAGRAFQPEAARVLGAADQARAAVAEVRELRGGTVAFGTFGSANHYLSLSELVGEFRARHPDVRLRLVGQNSSEVADQVRDGLLEAAIVVLPIDDRGLEVHPAIRDETLYVSVDPERLRVPVTIEQLAKAPLILFDAGFGWDDPTRRQLAERAQRAGVTLEPIVELEDLEPAMALAARGFGDTIASRTVSLGSRFPKRLGTISFDPPLYDTFALIKRRGAHLSPGVRELVTMVQKRIAALGRRLDAGEDPRG